MRRQASKMLAALGLAALLGGSAAAAELQANLKVTVPFSFEAGRTLLPAGQYSIERMNLPGTLLIRNLENSEAIYVRVIPAENNREDLRARLVFNKYGDRYFLAQIWNGGGLTGAELPKSRQEREMSASVRPERVLLVARK